jgi:hypothetical protein
MSIQLEAVGNDEPIAVSPKRAQAMLDIGQTRMYELINDGRLVSYKDGKNRRILMSSILKYVDGLLAKQGVVA